MHLHRLHDGLCMHKSGISSYMDGIVFVLSHLLHTNPFSMCFRKLYCSLLQLQRNYNLFKCQTLPFIYIFFFRTFSLCSVASLCRCCRAIDTRARRKAHSSCRQRECRLPTDYIASHLLIAGFQNLKLLSAMGWHAISMLIFEQGFGNDVDYVDYVHEVSSHGKRQTYMFCSIEIKCNKLHDDRTRCQKLLFASV